MNTPNRPASLAALRMIWAALILGPIVFGVVVMTIAAQRQANAQPILLYIAIGMLATMVPVAYVVRSIVYRNGRTPEGAVSPTAYATGNILFWAMCEGSAFFSLVCAMQTNDRGTPFLLAGIALAAQIANFPTGRPLREP
jgi:hypothetical protein